MLCNCSTGSSYRLLPEVSSVSRESIDRYVRNGPGKYLRIYIFSSAIIIFNIVKRHRPRKAEGSVAARKRRSWG
jgi:hypothetical protein